MVQIDFELDGHKVDPGTMGPGLQRSMLKTIREALEEKIGNLSCSRHRQTPTVLCRGPNVVEMSTEVCGCCDQIIDQVENRLH